MVSVETSDQNVKFYSLEERLQSRKSESDDRRRSPSRFQSQSFITPLSDESVQQRTRVS